MGTTVTIDVRDRDLAQEVIRDAVTAAVEVLHRADDDFTTWRADSAISRLRTGEVGLDDCPPAVHEVVAACEHARGMTDGWFDPWRMPGGFDPTGLVKGWAAERAMARLREHGVRHALVNAGGDLVARGHASGVPTGNGWTVGIRDPWDARKLVAAVEVHDSAVATSGSYERGSLAVDPGLGRTVTRLGSATVLADDLGLADALATAATARGPQALGWLRRARGVEALLVTLGGHVLRTGEGTWGEAAWPGGTVTRTDR